MSKAAELAALIGSQSSLSNRNMIINGAMQVAQRATSATAQHGSGYITCDRWLHNIAYEDNLRFTVTQEADGPSGFSKSLKLQTTTAESAVDSNEVYSIHQRIEGQNLQSLGFGTSAAKKFTVSFYVKSSVAATYGFSGYLYNSATVFGQSYTINSADTWERKSITFDANTSGVILDDNTKQLQLNWYLMVGTDYTSGSNSGWEAFATNKQAVGHTANAVGTTANATWQITGVQLEVGEQATPFEHEDYTTTLTKCRRYYQKLEGGLYFGGFYAYTGSTGIRVPLIPSMRAAPTVTNYNVRNGSSGATASNISALYGGIDGFSAPIDGAGGSDTHFSHINQSFLEASAEL